VKLDRRTATLYGTIGGAVVVALAIGFLKFLPAVKKLEAARTDAEEAIVEAERAKDASAGPNYKDGVERFASERRRRVEEFETGRRRAALKLSAWFPGMQIPEGAKFPARDEFQRTYAFHRDRTANALHDLLAKAGVPEVGRIHLMKPAFLGGLPPKEEEMTRWQRLANVEKLLLEAAAKIGSYATDALEAERTPNPATETDEDFERFRVRGTFATPTRKATELLRALISAGDDFGAVSRIEGVYLRPGPHDASTAPTEDPPIYVDVALTVGFVTPPTKGEGK
jgi:hypothetical protein